METLVDRPRLVLALALLASAAGVVAWGGMPREEDPRLAPRIGLIVAPFPGADVLDVERLVVEPIEEQLAEVDAIEHIDTIVRAGVSIMNVRLRGSVTEPEPVWDEVEDALVEARAEMPAEALPPTLNKDILDTESVLVALTGSPDVLALADAADELKVQLLALSDVSRVLVSGDPGERVVVDYDDAMARRLGVSPTQLADYVRASNSTLPAGVLRQGTQQLSVRPDADFDSLEELRALPIPVGRPDVRAGLGAGLEGAAVPLSSLARVERRAMSPGGERARFDGAPAVMVGVIPVPALQAEVFGEHVQAALDRFAEEHPDIELSMVAFQPERVSTRLSELGFSLLLGVGIVAGVLIFFMGFRVGVVVASVVPLVTFASIATYAATGGVLHQMAVAALVIALGLLVDNAIVVAETMQRRLDSGLSPSEAMRQTVAELRLPLGAATGTTLASFVPMLLAPGNTGDFTRAIPVVVMLTLSVSYLYALLVTPILCRYGLRAAPSTEESRFDRLAARMGRFAATRPWPTALLTLALLGASASFALGVRFNFFPSSDRDQFTVSIELDEGTHIDETDRVSRHLERWLSQRDEVENVSAFVGRSLPRFYYNLPSQPSAPHMAQLVVNTTSVAVVDRVRDELERFAAESFPGALVIAKRLEQGPPTAAPIEVRVIADDLMDLHDATEQVRQVLRAAEGTRHVRADQGLGTPTLLYRVDDAAVARQGMARQSVAFALLRHASGWPISTFRAERDPIPIVLRSSLGSRSGRGEDRGAETLAASDVVGPRAALPLAALADSSLEWQPAVIHHRDGRRVAHVLSEHVAEQTYESVFAKVRPTLDALELPVGATWEVGGALAESAVANESLGKFAPLAALLLIGILLAEFNSFRRLSIVLATAPLAVLGIWPGLYLLDLPFGFVALLGGIALIGIAVNGAIVLLDVTEQRRSEGASIEEALIASVQLRTRPILLTTATTIAGLCPLLISDSTLWPPMAAAMISGLLIATLLTLGFVPALYRLLFRDPKLAAPTR